MCLGGVAAADAASLDGRSHVFCAECILAWAAVTSRCPLCKRAFTTVTRRQTGQATRVAQREQRPGDADDAAVFAAFAGSEEEQDDEEEETPCELCGAADDEDELLLCDGAGCTGACHVRCAGLPGVPAGDWFCARCSQHAAAQQAAEAEGKPEDAAAAAATPQHALTPPPQPAASFERFRFAARTHS